MLDARQRLYTYMSGTPRCGADSWARRYSTGSESDRVLAEHASRKSTRSLSLPALYRFIQQFLAYQAYSI
jgi:hypothetical protein